jgi:hypothetical protein
MKFQLALYGYSLIEASNAKSCELWSNGVEAITLVLDELGRTLYAVREDHSMDELNLQGLSAFLQGSLPLSA